MTHRKQPIGFIFTLLIPLGMVLAGCTITAPATVFPSLIIPTPTDTPTSAPDQPTATSPGPTVPPTVTMTPTITRTPTGEPCEDAATFVDDVTIEDGTEIEPDKPFTKTWRLTNSGTCPWTTEYAVVFSDGDQMDGPDETPLVGEVAPGATVDISVDLTSPEVGGTYQGNWLLRNAEGQTFGTGEDAEWPFYVEIAVTVAGEQIQLGQPTWRDPFNNAANWFLVDTAETRFQVQGGNMVMTSFNPGTLEEWGLSNRPALTDFYLEMTATTGAQCSGRDRYGFIFRATDPNHGYVFSFACNGTYRLYNWDDGTFNSLKAWTSSSLIISGPNQTNRLGVHADGNQIKLYANRKVLAVITDSSYANGRFGLVIGSSETNNFQVFLDEVSYWLNP
ncbi:MAG: NBR1-Ig-like domain-containing protein [Anaerolineales bacterium]|jgi:hypothetical protein